MRVVYYPSDDYGPCTPESRRIEHPSTVHFHCASDAAVVRAYHESLRLRAKHDKRYFCITGPRGRFHRVAP